MLSSRKFCGAQQTQPLQLQFPKQGRPDRLFGKLQEQIVRFYLIPAQLIEGRPRAPPVIGCATSKAERVGPEAQGLSSKRGRVRAVSGSDLQGLPAGSDFNTTEKKLEGECV